MRRTARDAISGGRRWKHCLVLGTYIFFLIIMLGRTYFLTGHDWDMIGYMAVITSWQTSNPVVLHRSVYQQIRKAIPPATYKDFTTGPFRGDIAANPYHLAEQLPFYSIKPLYVDLVWLGYKLGLGFQRSMRLVSVLSLFALGILCYQWMRVYLTDLQSAIISACLFITAPMHHLARFNGPDALNGAVLAFSLYFLFEMRRQFLGLLLLCIAPLIRPDSEILSLVVLAYLATSAPPRLAVRKFYATVLAGTVSLCVFVVARFSGNYGWTVLFANTFRSAIPNPGEVTPIVTFGEYWTALRGAIVQLLSGDALIVFVFFIVLCLLVGVTTIDPNLRDMLILLVVAIACRIAIYPNIEARYFAFAYVPTVIGYTACMSQWKREQQARGQFVSRR